MKLYLATPMYGGNCTAGYASSIINLAKVMPYQHMFVTNESLITRARNSLAHMFMRSDCTHLLFVDADVAFDHQAIPQMVDADKDIIGGLYAKKFIDWNAVRHGVLQGAMPQNLSQCGSNYYVQGDVEIGSPIPTEVKSIGTGLMLISRNVFEKMSPQVTESKFGSAVVGEIDSNTRVKQFFETGIDDTTGEFFSEDYMFCQTWRNLGGKVWAAPWVRTIHIGTHHFG